MLWYQGFQNNGLSNHEFISALTCTIWSQCTPFTRLARYLFGSRG